MYSQYLFIKPSVTNRCSVLLMDLGCPNIIFSGTYTSAINGRVNKVCHCKVINLILADVIALDIHVTAPLNTNTAGP